MNWPQVPVEHLISITLLKNSLRRRGRGEKIPLEKGIATHSSIAWRIPWTEEPGELQSMGLQREATELTHTH